MAFSAADMVAVETALWDKRIAVELVGGVPFKMYADRPRRIETLLPFADLWGARPHVVQGDRVLRFDQLRPASAAKAATLTAHGAKAGDRILIFAQSLIQQGIINSRIGFRDTCAFAEQAQRRGGIAAPSQTSQSWHAWVIPTFNVIVFYQLKQFSFAGDDIAHIQTSKLVLLRKLSRQMPQISQL